MELDRLQLAQIITTALMEDIGIGDITTQSVVPATAWAEGVLATREAGTVAGLPVAEGVFLSLDGRIEMEYLVQDGDRIEAGQVLAYLRGPAPPLITAERVALNFIQRLSGIATATAKLVGMVAGTQASVIDTRKTTPGLRVLEKYAVRMGGGRNHRFGLYDAVLIKDNHITVAGGITAAVAAARAQVPHTAKIEVETENMEQVLEALRAGVDIIMLDNMEPDLMREAVQQVNGRALLEASGVIRAHNIRAVAETGVNLISIGALTYASPALDIGLDLTTSMTQPGDR